MNDDAVYEVISERSLKNPVDGARIDALAGLSLDAVGSMLIRTSPSPAVAPYMELPAIERYGKSTQSGAPPPAEGSSSSGP